VCPTTSTNDPALVFADFLGATGDTASRYHGCREAKGVARRLETYAMIRTESERWGLRKSLVVGTAVGLAFGLVGLAACVGDDPATAGGSSTSDASSSDVTSPDVVTSDVTQTITCDAATTVCGTSCVDTMTDKANCGACSNACVTGFDCTGGVCGNTPIQMSGFNGTQCALLADGDVYCWGYNAFGAIGDGTTNDAHTATKIATDSTGAAFGNVKQIGVGYEHACALKNDGNVFCWGDNKEGVLAVAPAVEQSKPLENSYLAAMGTKAIYAGGGESCVIDSSNNVDCWGYNNFDQLGHTPGSEAGDQATCLTGGGPTSSGANNDHCNTTPRVVPTISNVTQVAIADSDICALEGGSVWCWGEGTIGVNGSTGADSPNPTEILTASSLPLTNITAIVGGVGAACAITTAKQMVCWGADTNGQFGNGARSMPSGIPVPFGAIDNITAAFVSSGEHICAVSGGHVYCAGLNVNLQLGLGATSCDADGGLPDAGGQCESHAPLPVVDSTGTGMLGNVVEVSGTNASTCARTSDGKIYCWGYNGDGETGHDPSGDATCTAGKCTPLPTLVTGLP
jgi:alpha-tubulin suppressor-like RCC1 family protein